MRTRVDVHDADAIAMGKANIAMYHPGSAGSFVKVVMVNFMCHHHLTVELGPRINYIVGENGSGKSAVLTALTVALGAKAKSVGRSSTKSVKGMIKSGTQQAKLTVVISNDGEDAFMPATYGRTIIIEKVLAKVGANSLKIKNAQGETIGTKSDELARITDHFAIDVDNPIVVMTQDMAKQFLNSGDDGKKYEFFLRATLLQAVQERATIAKNSVDEMKMVLDEHNENIPVLKKNIEALQHELNAFERVEQLRSKSIDFRRRFAWSKITQMERKLAEERGKLAKYQDEKAKLIEQISKLEKARDDAKKQKDTLQGQHDEYMAKVTTTAAERRAIEAEYKEAARQLQKVKTDQLTEETKIKQLSKKTKDAETKIQRVVDMQKGETTQVEANIQRFNQAMVQAKADVTQCEQHIEQLESTRQNSKRESTVCAQRHRGIEAGIDNIRKQIATLKNTSSNKLVLYHSKMPALVDAIERRRGDFSKPPLGPVGTHITLKNQEWVTPVEECLSGVMNSFVVATPQDMDKVRKLAQECGVPNVNVVCVNFNRQRYNIPSERVPNPSQFTTVMSVIECTHDVIFNLCVDQCQIENSVLLKDEGPAVALFNSNEAKAKNIGSIYTPLRKIFSSGNTTRNEAFKNMNTARKLGADSKSQIKQFEARIKEEQENAKRASAAQVAASKAVKDVESALVKAQNDLKKLVSAAHDARRALEQAKSDAEDTSAAGYDVSALQDELDSLNAELITHRSSLAEVERECEEKQKAYDDAKNALAEKQALGESFKEHARELTNNLSAATDLSVSTAKSIARKEEQLRDADPVIANAEQTVAAMHEEIETCAEQTTAICTRSEAVEAGDINIEPEKLLRMYENSKEQMRTEEQRHKRPFEEVNDELSFESRKLAKLDSGFGKSMKLYGQLRKGVKARQKQVQVRATEISKIVSHRFNYYMSKKGHSGRVLVDFKDATLSLEVKDGEKGKSVKDMRSMSGGERSYSTLAFNLSLGDTNESPFSAMDEFDVFMDAVNRKVSIDSLLRFARKHVDKQFIFITPQDISAVDANAEDIKIMKMAPARVDA